MNESQNKVLDAYEEYKSTLIEVGHKLTEDQKTSVEGLVNYLVDDRFAGDE